jgi:hypothetical protein
MKISLSFLFILSMIFGHTYAQLSFNVDENNITIQACTDCSGPASNTYLNGLSNATLSWTVVDTDLPDGWEFSHCFPNCYDIGVTAGVLSISSGQQYYLNCHVYPNEVAGEGSITMEITDNNGTTEQVTWNAIIGSAGLLENILYEEQNKIQAIYTMQGQRIPELLKNQLQIVIFSDNTRKQVFISE